jgi:uncharacterized repeat protein (TIGR03803 family)
MLSAHPLSVKLDFAKIAFLLLVFCVATPLASPAQTLTTLHSFSYADGAYPRDALIQGADGILYATTEGGGSTNCNNINQDGCGTIFKITTAGAFTSVYSFCTQPPCQVGYQPWGSLFQASDGNFYGTSNQGGHGWVFKMTPTFGVSGLHMFTGGDGAYPFGALLEGPDGNLYGTTSGDEFRTNGTVFKITTAGVLTNLHIFMGSDGDSPVSNLVLGPDGFFYGTTLYGGNNNCNFGCGTIFKVSSGGDFSTIHMFTGADGSQPSAGLALGIDGNLYGTTTGTSGGPATVFKISLGGTLTTIHNFTGSEGFGSTGSLLLASDGNFWGTTASGGNQEGTIFKVTPGGTLTTIHSFRSDGADGAMPAGGLLQASDGNFYGTTSAGGAHAPNGTVFMLTGPMALPTTTTLTTAPNPSNLGQQVTMTATVHARSGTPTGNVVFESDGVVIGTVALSSGVAVLHDSNLPMGTNAVIAIYQGGGNFGPSISNLVDQMVQTPGSTTTVTSAPNPSLVGQQVVITATVGPSGPPMPTGTVSFTSNGTAISGCTGINLSSDMAVCTTSSLALGTDMIVATYSGDSNYGGSSGTLTQFVNPVPMAIQFVPATPCRVVDTRNPNGPFGGPAIQGNSSRSFPLAEGDNPCGIPANAIAYSLNVTVVPMGRLGYLTIWPTGEGQPVVSTLNSLDGRTKANAAIVPAGTPSGAVSVFVSNTTNVILDIDGYFVTNGASTLAFYPLAPCRVVDTRQTNFPTGLGAPAFGAMESRDLPVLSNSPCFQGLPHQPKAYSFNVTVVPNPDGQHLGYLSIWPSDQQQPVVSTLNNPTATAVANAAIVPAAANGDVSVFTLNSTDVIIDTNGYFATPAQGGLSFYALTPCRVLDTRNGQPFMGEHTVNVVGSQCAPPASAEAYVFNATVVPSGFLGFLTLWPDGEQQPTVSTLNARDGLITSNMAIVPTTNGSIDAYASQLTNLIMDISGYFAP